jgi:hypothetical protein
MYGEPPSEERITEMQENWLIPAGKLTVQSELGRGAFGVVRHIAPFSSQSFIFSLFHLSSSDPGFRLSFYELCLTAFPACWWLWLPPGVQGQIPDDYRGRQEAAPTQ